MNNKTDGKKRMFLPNEVPLTVKKAVPNSTENYNMEPHLTQQELDIIEFYEGGISLHGFHKPISRVIEFSNIKNIKQHGE